MKEENTTLSNYIDTVQSEGKYWFLRKTAQLSLALNDNAFRKSAHRLIAKGRLNRVRGDFYMIIPPEYRATGAIPVTWFIHALMSYLKQPYYVGLLSAASVHGAAHQQPMAFQVVTDKPTRPITVGQVYIEFISKKIIKSHFYQSIKTASGLMYVSTPAMTAFDLIRYMNMSGQVNHVATVLSELVDQLTINELVELLKSQDVEIATAQRLGYVMENLQLKIDLEPLFQQIKEKKHIPRLLVTGGAQSVIEHNRRWDILVNEILEPDEL